MSVNPLPRLAYPIILALGLVSALAFAPLFWLPLFWFAFGAGLLLIMQAETGRGALLRAWLWAFGHSFTSFHWVSWSAMNDPGLYWLVPVILVLMPGAMSLFLLPALWSAWRWRSQLPLALALVVALWITFEALRAFLLSGFPWNSIGQIWAVHPVLAQSAAWGGPWLLSIFALLFGFGALLLLQRRWRWAVGLSVVLPLLLFVSGTLRITLLEPRLESTAATGARLGLVQANVPTSSSVSSAQLREDYAKHLAVSRQLPAGLDAVIWPESGYDFFLNRDEEGRLATINALGNPPLWITGGPWLEAGDEAGRPEQVWNTLYLVDGSGEIVDHYFKSHLVPFGEYVPRWAPVGRLIGHLPNFSAGPGMRSLETEVLGNLGPLICYEDVFAHRVTEQGNRPDWLLSVTEDGWFGRFAGPQQHAVQAQMRAIEEGLPLVRLSNPGRSGLFDAFGRLAEQSALGVPATLVVDIPERLPPTLTSQLRHGTMVLALLLVWVSVGVIVLRSYDDRYERAT